MRRFPSWCLLPAMALATACSKPADKAAEAPAADTTAAAAPAPSGPQAIVTVLYQTPKDTAAFEKYYRETHLPLVSAGQQEIGFTKAELTRFKSALDGKKPAFYRQAELYFNSLDDAKKGTATAAFKKVGDDFKNFDTHGLIGMLAVETGDKGTAACPALVTVIYNTPKDTAAFEKYPPPDCERGTAGDRLRAGRPHPVRVESRRLCPRQVPPGGALLQLAGRAQEGDRHARLQEGRR